jgi:TrkA-C domain
VARPRSSDSYGDETTVVKMHSGNGEHDEMDRRAIACFDQALADVGLAGLLDAALYFDLVFFIVLASVLFQGTTIAFVARKLGLEAPVTTSRLDLLEFLPAQKSQSDLVEMSVAPGSAVSGKQIVALGLPRSALIVLISRDERFITPHGATTRTFSRTRSRSSPTVTCAATP